MKNEPEMFNEIINYSLNIQLNNFTQMYYNYINEVTEIHKCYCGNDCGFISLKGGYRVFCSVKCASNSEMVKNKISETCYDRYGVERYNNIEKSKQTNLKKYGVEYVSQSDVVKKKVKQTNLKKYGVESYTQTKEYLIKTKKTSIKKYGVDHHSKLESQIKKRKETNMKKYGVDSYLKTDEGKEKIKRTTMKIYGVEYASQSPIIKNKIVENNLKKYGCESTNQLNEVKKKKIKTSTKHFGVENPSQHKSTINKIKKTKYERYGNENYNNVAKFKQTMLRKYGVENPTQYKEFIDKAINTTIERYGEIWLKHAPTYNANSIIYLDMLSEKLDLHIQHALNGGEKKFIRYWVDGYIEEYNICIEWDEAKHNTKKQTEKDLKREQFLVENFNCKIIRINEKEFLMDIKKNITTIISDIEKIKTNKLKYE